MHVIPILWSQVSICTKQTIKLWQHHVWGDSFYSHRLCFLCFFFFFKIWVVVWFQNVTTPGWGPSESTSRLRALVLTVRMISTVCFSTDFGTANESPGGGRELHVVNQAHFQFQKINKQLRIDFAQSHILLNAYWPITAQNRDLLFCIIVSWYNDTVSEWLATACVPGWNVWRILIEIKG